MGADDDLADMAIERQTELAIPAHFVPERASPKTAGELIHADAEDRERVRRRLEQLQTELEGGGE